LFSTQRRLKVFLKKQHQSIPVFVLSAEASLELCDVIEGGVECLRTVTFTGKAYGIDECGFIFSLIHNWSYVWVLADPLIDYWLSRC
jgi:hypothetical protein